jgi:hypothetical protein
MISSFFRIENPKTLGETRSLQHMMDTQQWLNQYFNIKFVTSEFNINYWFFLWLRSKIHSREVVLTCYSGYNHIG